MKSVTAAVFITTLVVAIVAIGAAFWGGMQVFKKQHKCTVDKATGKATCTA